MALLQSLVIISVSMSTTLSRRLSVEAHTYPDRQVIIRELVSPKPTLTLERGAYLKILKRNKNEKDKILKLEDIEYGPDEHRRPIKFKQVAPEPDPGHETFEWTPHQLAARIVAERVQLRKPPSVTFDAANQKAIINGLEFKVGDNLKIENLEGPIETIDDEMLLIKPKGMKRQWPIFPTNIHDGKVQYKDHEEQWHQFDQMYESIQPTQMAVALGKYDRTNPRNSFPKKEEMIHCMLFYLQHFFFWVGN